MVLTRTGAFSCLVQMILIAMGASYMAATLPPLLLTLYFLQTFYLRTSRQMRLLDLEAKSPLYRQFTETIEGAATIRTFGCQRQYEKEFLPLLDESQKPFYLLLCIQRWLGLVLDLIVGAVAVVLVAIACATTTSSAGSLGVAMTTIISITAQLDNLITCWTQAEAWLGSVARTKTYQETTPNENTEVVVPPNTLDTAWPEGVVVFNRVTVNHGDATHLALNDISFTAQAGQKVGICGRTGRQVHTSFIDRLRNGALTRHSGKSTLLSVLLRLVNPSGGKITIDGIDISDIPRNTVCDRLICVPQHSVLLPISLRLNLDPWTNSATADIQSVLEELQIWSLVPARGGLDAQVNPGTYSQGEKQLLALGLAILRNRNLQSRSILILDEATSNMDNANALLVKSIIGREFKLSTVLTVAHKLETLEQCDMILELKEGRITQVR